MIKFKEYRFESSFKICLKSTGSVITFIILKSFVQNSTNSQHLLMVKYSRESISFTRILHDIKGMGL